LDNAMIAPSLRSATKASASWATSSGRWQHRRRLASFGMSVVGQTRRFRDVRGMSDLHPATDVFGAGRHVAFGPESGSEQRQRVCDRLPSRSVQPTTTNSSRLRHFDLTQIPRSPGA
jgi:hypothetical protein